MWLFCYGSNNPDQLEDRIGRQIDEAIPAYAEGYSRVFRGMSQRWGGGTASLVKDPDKTTYGFCIKVSEKDLSILDRFEGVAQGIYKRTNLTIITDNGEHLRAVAYISLRSDFNRPSKKYLEAIIKTIGSFWEMKTGTIADIPVRNNNPFLGDKAWLFGESVKDDLGLEDFDLSQSGDTIRLMKITVPENMQEQGIGTEALNLLCEYADDNMFKLDLKLDWTATPQRQERLRSFYERFGFIDVREDKHSILDPDMIRLPD